MPSHFAHLPKRTVLAVMGEDAADFLERVVTCRTDTTAPGDSGYGALLTPQGKIISDFLFLRTSDGFLLDAPSSLVADLEKRLKMFRLRAQVEIGVVEGMIVLGGLEPVDAVRPVSGSAHVFLDRRAPSHRLRVFALEQAWRQFHGHEAEWTATLDQYEADRIARGVPEGGADFSSADVFPADVNMDRMGGVDLKKGCFVGQEVVSRMHRRGKTRKRTLAIRGERLAAGLDVRAETSVGTITSAQGDAALALIRIDRMGTAVKLRVDDNPVTLDAPDWLASEIAALSNNDER